MKKYCNYCGNIIPNRAKLCPICGYKTEQRQNYTQEKNVNDWKKKELGASRNLLPANKISIISVLWGMILIPGLGQLIARRTRRGLVLMILTFSLIIIAVVVPLSTEFYQTIYFLNPIVAFLIFWGVIDGVRQIKNYNQAIEKYSQLG